ncbi:LPXTG cell wall anchor domain-containing protein [Enterococcus sp. DIV1297f]|uniref:LPXTG cell wall anchor domain-containing protein n=1 Tax=Enterococcus sp. DIV1297f TaxID=2774691 RepID=UPI003D2DC9A7
MQKAVGRLFCIFAVLFALQFPLYVYGGQVQSVESEGSVGFTGAYEPIGPPDPPPSTSPQRPGGSLPQTNMIEGAFVGWIGILLVVGVSLAVGEKRKKQYKNYWNERRK